MTGALRTLVLAVVAIAAGFFLLAIHEYWPIPLVAGALLLGWSWLAPPKAQLMLSSGDTDMLIPEKWDEREISLGLERYKGNPNVLAKYLDGILSRFLAGQDKRTIERRAAFLESFNEYAAIARESYKWQRYMKGGRAKLEEDTEDAKAEAALRQAQADLDLVELDKELKRQEKLLQIEKLKREMAELNKATSASPSAQRPSASEARDQKRRDLNERENRVIEEMRITRANPTLSEEQKRRKLNALEDVLAQIHEEQAGLL